jgi:hypothetical protein
MKSRAPTVNMRDNGEMREADRPEEALIALGSSDSDFCFYKLGLNIGSENQLSTKQHIIITSVLKYKPL